MDKVTKLAFLLLLISSSMINGAEYYPKGNQYQASQGGSVKYYSQTPTQSLTPTPYSNKNNNYQSNNNNYDKSSNSGGNYVAGNDYAMTLPVPLYYYFNPQFVDFVYTINFYEMSGSTGRDGYVFQGIACYVWPVGVIGSSPVYRWWSASLADHRFSTVYPITTDNSTTYVSEGVGWYMWTTPYQGAVPLFEYLGTVNHYYTTNWTELHGGVPEEDITFKGILGYCMPEAPYGAKNDIGNNYGSANSYTGNYQSAGYF